ncbi:MAG: MBL fold metallo-hydrolase [Candidatus Hodarchaeales archaeon]|jgi:glyoxylase-like metal-dependent hydrolase (beta-lactamase superfamily II)
MSSFIPIVNDVHFFHPKQRHPLFRWRGISSNAILLEGEKGLAFVDSGGISSRRQILLACEQFGIKRKKNIICIHTHGHIDHCGGDFLLANHFHARFWASREAIPFVKGGSPIFIEHEKKFLITSFQEVFTGPEWFVRIMSRFLLGRNRPITSSLKILDLGTDPIMTGFQPIPLPGHHVGHVGLFNKEEKIILAGDLLDPRYGMKPLLTSPSSDFEAMRESLDVVRDLSPEILIPSHGEPLIGNLVVQQSIHEAKAILDRSLQRVLASLDHEPRTLPQLSAELHSLSLGPGDVHRRIFIHSVLKYLLSQSKISKQVVNRKTTFSLE